MIKICWKESSICNTIGIFSVISFSILNKLSLFKTYFRIQYQIDSLKKKTNLSNTLVNKSSSTLTALSLTKKTEDPNQTDPEKELEQLTPEHREFLNKHKIDEESVINNLKRMKSYLMKVRI